MKRYHVVVVFLAAFLGSLASEIVTSAYKAHAAWEQQLQDEASADAQAAGSE